MYVDKYTLRQIIITKFEPVVSLPQVKLFHFKYFIYKKDNKFSNNRKISILDEV